MKKITVNYKVVYGQSGLFESLKKMFLSAADYAEKNDLMFIEREKINNLEFNEKIESFLKVNFILDKKAIGFLFQNYIKQIKDDSNYNLAVKIQYTIKSLKTLKKLFDIFTNKSAFFEIKKTDLKDFLTNKYQTEIIKTAKMTIDSEFKLPEIIKDDNFISAELHTITTDIKTKITNKYNDLLDFIK